VTSSVAVFEVAIRGKSIHLIKSCFKTRKKENMVIKDIFYINLHLKDRLEIHSLLKIADARGSAEIIYRI